MSGIKDYTEFQKEFQEYVNKYELIREFAYKMKSTPGGVVSLFHAIGLEALKQFESEINKNFGVSVPGLLNDLKNKNYSELEKKLFKLMRE